jgi:hypothetical protein
LAAEEHHRPPGYGSAGESGIARPSPLAGLQRGGRTDRETHLDRQDRASVAESGFGIEAIAGARSTHLLEGKCRQVFAPAEILNRR